MNDDKKSPTTLWLEKDLKEEAERIFTQHGMTLDEGLELLLEIAIERKSPCLEGPESPETQDVKKE